MRIFYLNKSIKIFITLILALTIISISPNVKAENISVTRDTSIDIDLNAEKKSDLNFKSFYSSLDGRAKNEFAFETTTRALDDGNYKQKIDLKRASKENVRDELNNNCISNIESRRIGICNDGIYKIDVTSFDAAGNKSKTKSIEIERDTVSPDSPKVEIKPNDTTHTINLNIEGESVTDIIINNNFVYKLTNQTNANLSAISSQNWRYNTKYTFEVALKDRAGNISKPTIVSHKTPQRPITGKGGIPGTSQNDFYGNKKGNELEAISFDVKLKYKSNDYSISDIKIPAPLLTYTQTLGDKVNIYGVAVEKNHEIIADIEIVYMSKFEASVYCTENQPENVENCMLEFMNINSIKLWDHNISTYCNKLYQSSKQIQDCIISENYHRRNSNKKESKIEAQHVKVGFYKDDPQNTPLGHIWNDSEDGRFKFNTDLNDNLKIGDRVKAITSIFGDFEIDGMKIDYRGGNDEEAKNNGGLWSEFSNVLQIDESEYTEIDGRVAKVLDVPYFNQLREPNGSTKPEAGWMMCGAASAVMVAGYYEKLAYNKEDEHDLKRYMYRDEGQGIEGKCDYFDPNTGQYVETNYGAWLITNHAGLCQANNIEGIRYYLRRLGIESKYLSYRWGSDGIPILLDFDSVKNSIDKGNLIIFSTVTTYFSGGEVDHIFVIKGYTLDGKIIVNDPYQNLQAHNEVVYSYDGKDAVYEISFARWRQNYAVEFYIGN